MMNEEFIVRMFEKQKERLEMVCGENVYNLFTRCSSVHLLKCFHINLRSIFNVIVFCKMVHL